MAWECSICLVPNDDFLESGQKRIVCEACESDRPRCEAPAVGGSSGKVPFGSGGGYIKYGDINESNGQSVVSALSKGVQFSVSNGDTVGDASKSLFTRGGGRTIVFGDSSVGGEFGEPSTGKAMFGDQSGVGQSTKPGPEDGDTDAGGIVTCIGGESSLKKIDADKVYTGDVYTWGNGECDQLPFPDEELNEDGVLDLPRKVVLPKDMPCINVAAGSLHSVILTSEGRVYTWGCDDDGAVGRKVESADERMCGALSEPNGDEFNDVVDISAGNSHGALLRSDGGVYIWGRFKNSKGLSASYRTDCLPHRVPLSWQCIKLVSGGDHLMALCLDEFGNKTVLAIGSNEDYQKGINPNQPFEDEDKDGLVEGLNPQPIVAPDGVVALDDVFCGPGVSILKCSNAKGEHQYFAVGRNGTGECGIGDTERNLVKTWTEITVLRGEDIKDIRCGDYHCVANSANGPVYTWGHPEYLGLDRKKRVPVYSPRKLNIDGPVDHIAAGGRTNFALSSSNVYGCGSSQQCQLMEDLDDPVPRFRPVKSKAWNRDAIKISVGSQHVLLLLGNRGLMPMPKVAIRRGVKRAHANPTVGATTTKASKDISQKRVKRISRVRERSKIFTYIKAGGDPIFLRAEERKLIAKRMRNRK